METKVTNIILSGVGGQGIILAGRILAKCALDAGFDVKANELHGMAQRGGSVLSHIRFGKKVNSPLIPEGKADFLVAMEELESLRYERFLMPGGTVILNTRKVVPSSIEEKDYPKDIKEQLEKGINLAAEFIDNPFSGKFKEIDASVASKQAYETMVIKNFKDMLPDELKVKSLLEKPNAEVEAIRKENFEAQKQNCEGIREKVVPVKHTITITKGE